MPVATVDINATKKFQLKTCDGGEVTLKRMSYGESVQRRAMMKLSFDASGGKNDFKGEMAMASVDIQRYEFQCCIVDHNLTDANDRPLDLTNVRDMSILDPRVGQEIETYISKMNDFDEGADEEGNSESGASLHSLPTDEATS